MMSFNEKRTSSGADDWMEDEETPHRETANASEMEWVEQQQRMMAFSSSHARHHPESSSYHYFEETARPSDMAWVEQNMMAARQEASAVPAAVAAATARKPAAGDDDEDCTWTGSFIVATLEEMKSQKNQKQDSVPSSHIEKINNDNVVEADSDRKVPSAGSIAAPGNLQSNVEIQELSFKLPARRSINNNVRRTPGPSERAYLARYSGFVSKKLKAFRQKHPNQQLRDYRAMNQPQQQQEQQRVLNLLNRLGITNHEVGVMHDDDDDDFDNNDHQPKDNVTVSDDEVEVMQDDADQTKDDLTVDENDNDDMKKSNNNVNDVHGSVEDSYLTANESMLLLTPKRNSEIIAAKSMVLLSPKEPTTTASRNRSRDTSMELKLPPSEANNNNNNAELMSSPDFPQPDDPSDSSTQSIERARSYRFHSPSSAKEGDDEAEGAATERRHKKRLATTSGKRGADSSRSRLVQFDDHDVPSSTEKILEESMRRLSVAPVKVFTASQSPILPLTDGSRCHDDSDEKSSSSSSESDHFVQKDISFGQADDDDDQNGDDDHHRESSSQSKPYRDSIDESARWDSSRKPFSNIPPNQGSTIRLGATLKSGATFHLQPLQVERFRPRAPPTQTFADPLEDYHGREHKQLYRIYKWIRGLEKAPPVCTAVVLSMTEEQIVDVTLKILLKDSKVEPPCESQSHAVFGGMNSGGGNSNQGQTLIVARTREELEYWSRAIREGSGLSTVNHSSLPVKERKSMSTAKRCCRFGVTLTTFDALKSPDVTVSLDENGFIRFGNVGAEDGWFSTRDSSQAAASQAQASQPLNANKQLSVLHLIQWKRVIFVDEVGRKTYLAKPETARFVAARALAAESRLVFFPKGEEEETSGIKALINSDKKALKTLAEVLRLEGDTLEECKLREKIVDFADASNIPSKTTTRSRSRGRARHKT